MRLTLLAMAGIVLGFAVTGHAEYQNNCAFSKIINITEKGVAAAEMIGNALNQTNSLILSLKDEIKSLKEQFYTGHIVGAGTALTAAIMGMAAAFIFGRHMANQYDCWSQGRHAPPATHVSFLESPRQLDPINL